MISKKLQSIFDGTVAHFWVPGHTDEGERLPGYVRRMPNGSLQLELILDLDPISVVKDEMLSTRPQYVEAATTEAPAVFFDTSHPHHRMIFGNAQASTKRIQARAVAAPVDLSSLTSTKITRLDTDFLNTAKWFGFDTMKATAASENSVPHSVQVSVESVELGRTILADETELVVMNHWSVTGEEDNRVIYAPVCVRLEPTKPTEWHTLFKAMMAVQDLLSLAADGFTPASSGRLVFEMDNEEPRQPPSDWWSSRLMHTPAEVKHRPVARERTLFHLTHIGGVEGIARWVKLSAEHPRAVGPLTTQYRVGIPVVESQVMEVATALEYYTKYNDAAGAPWAKNQPGLPKFAPLVHASSDAVKELLSNRPDEWCAAFNKANNSVKHLRQDVNDPYDLSVLARSARVVMLCFLLDTVAKNTKPSTAICRHFRNDNLKHEVKELLDRLAPPADK